MANPEIAPPSSLKQDILAQASLSTGNNDFTVGAAAAWTLKSFTLHNTSGSTVQVQGYVVPSGGTARQFLYEDIPAHTTFVVDPAILAMLPAAAKLRLVPATGSVIDLVVTGLVAA